MARRCFWSSLLLVALFATGCVKQVRDDTTQGRSIGTYRLSVYWLSHERWYRGKKRTPLLHKGRRIAWVSSRFARALRMQGSGRLRNGRIVQYAGRCRSRRLCLRVRRINTRRYPMGVGAAGRALRPLHSLAADTRLLPFGAKLYIPALGRLLRKHGRRHNGCFVVHDRGGRIRGQRLDLFAGNRKLYRKYLRKLAPRAVKVYVDHPRCSPHLASR